MKKKRYTHALERVLGRKKKNLQTGLREPILEGIYMSKLQIQKLSENLLAHSDGPDGILFMIGRLSASVKTVELIPYKKRDGETPITFFRDSNGVTGGIEINIGGRNPDSVFNFTITGDGLIGEFFPPEPGVVRQLENGEGITNPNQRTPPPFS